MLSVLQYAVEVLQVQHIIVCGHYHCGGVLHAMHHEDSGVIDQWLDQVKAIHRSHVDELDRMADSALRFDRMVELNVDRATEECRPDGHRAKSLVGGTRASPAWMGL